jgi:hypothetical protein
MMRSISSLIVLSLAAATAAAAPPQRVEVGYEVARNGAVVADVTERLEHDGRSYRLTETWKGKGVYALRGEAVRTSRGAVAADGLRPQAFEDKRPGRDARHAEFDPAAKTPTLERQDRLSFIWTFAFAVPSGPVAVSVSDGKGVTTYAYQPAGRERVKTPAGEFDALKLVKRRDNPQDRTTEIWLAADRGHVPVKVLYIDKDGTRIEQSAVRISLQ